MKGTLKRIVLYFLESFNETDKEENRSEEEIEEGKNIDHKIVNPPIKKRNKKI